MGNFFESSFIVKGNLKEKLKNGNQGFQLTPTATMSANLKHFYEFEDFRLDALRPALWRDGKLVPIFPKSLEVLVLLVRSSGDIVSREELLETVWPDTFVEESNITYTVSQLRKALGGNGNARLIQTVPKRGYRFAGEVRETYANGGGARPDSQNGKHAQLSDADVPADMPALPPGKAPPAGLKPIARLAAGAVTLAIVVIAGFFVWTIRTQKTPGSGPADVNFQKLTYSGDIKQPVLSPDGNSFAFVRDRRLFVSEIDSGNEIQLEVPSDTDPGILRFSPDSRSIYFRSRVGFSVPANVFQIPRFGGSPRLVADNVWSGFDFSSDSKLIAFIRVNPGAAKSTLILKNLETKVERELTPLNLPSEFLLDGRPAFSPDGQKIAVVIFKKLANAPPTQLCVVDIETGTVEEINTPQLRQFEQVAWLPDGRSLAVSARENGKFFQLWRLEYPGGESQKITNDLNIYRGISLSADGKRLLARQFTLFSHLWMGESGDFNNAVQKTFGNLNRDGASGMDGTPDGDIVYVARIMGDYDLWLFHPADGSRRQLTKNAGESNQFPAVSPDGKSIFFNSNRSGAFHIWRMDVTGANQTQITFGEKQIEIYPQISIDSAWLYYIQKGASASAVWRKSLIDGRSEALTDAGSLAPDSFLSLSPDGKFLAFYNAVDKVSEEAEIETYQVCVISTEKPQTPRFFNIAASRLIARWAGDSASLDFIKNDAKGATIWRQNIDDRVAPTIVAEMPKAFVHNFGWSRAHHQLLLSMGQQSNDAILLTNFQP